MTVLASDAVIGVVYLTPKGRQLRRLPVEPDDDGDTIRFLRLEDQAVCELDRGYVLTPKPVEAPPSPIAHILGKPKDTVIAALPGLSDDGLEELLASDTRMWVRRAVAEEGARRAAGGRELPGAVAEVMPVQPVVEVAPAEVPPVVVVAQGPVDVEEIPLVVEAPAPVDVAEQDDLPWEASTDSDPPVAQIVDAPAAEQTDPPISPVEPEPTIGTAPISNEDRPAGGDRSGDDAAERASTAPPTDPPKPTRGRPRGWCPACRQLLSVRADGTMMQHFTPDNAKGPDGKRIDCQGVGLTPAAERPPEPRLPLPVAMKVEPPTAPVIDRPALVSPSSEPEIVAAVAQAAEVLAMGTAGEPDAELPPVVTYAVAPPPERAPTRYVIGGSAPYGWVIIDLETCGSMVREDGTIARWELREDAEVALVYVVEHGELPGDVEPETTEKHAPVPLESGPPSVIADAGPLDAFPPVKPSAAPRPPDSDEYEPGPLLDIPRNPIAELSQLVADAQRQGVRIRIVIEPIE